MRTKQVSHTADEAAEAVSGPSAKLGGARSLVGVPMLKDDELIGAIIIYRTEVRPFTDKQIALVQNFAAQAVIAIENTRLLNELRQRTDDLTESLERQTATSEVLQVISRSPGELAPVFDSILSNARRICEAKFAHLLLYDGTMFHPAAMEGAPSAYAERWKHGPRVLDARTGPARAVTAKQVVHILDIRQTDAYQEGDPQFAGMADHTGARTVLVVPMLKEDDVIGTFSVYRQEVRPFTDKQIELVSNFAKQAVIAIENTRLLNEVRESLAQQTATSEVLSVISSSPGELGPVFNAMLDNATRLSEAKFGVLLLWEAGSFRTVALHNAPPAFAEQRRRQPMIHPAPTTSLARLVATKQLEQIADLRAEKAYLDGEPGPVSLVELAGARTVINVPMLKENELIGCISFYRQEVRPFADKQIELVKNFAAQAVIAIENSRLLNELRESLQQQTATADVLKVISRSTFDLKTVVRAENLDPDVLVMQPANQGARYDASDLLNRARDRSILVQ